MKTITIGKKWLRLIIPAAIIIIGTIGFLGLTHIPIDQDKEQYQFVSASKGSIENTVSSSGTLKTVGTVSVLSQMTGTVEKVYADFNDRVFKDQQLIDLNTDLLSIETKETKASVMQARAKYNLQKVNYDSNLALYNKSLISSYELLSSKTDFEVAEANLQSAEAKLEKLEIELNQYALILSPIDGIVLYRGVDEGDTVVSGNSSTQLFTLAEDLKKMEIHAEVDELDISQITNNMPVRFSVDAYSDESFTGTVRQIRLEPETVNNIVTYTVIVDADNPEEKLLPGMTASLEFIVEQKEDVLLIPNTAFRFEPDDEIKIEAQKRMFEERISTLPEEEQEKIRAQFKAMEKARSSKSDEKRTGMLGLGMSGPGSGGPGGPPPMSSRKTSGTNSSGFMGQNGTEQNENRKSLWYLGNNNHLAMIMVETGVSDGTNTEIVNPQPDLIDLNIVLKIKVDI